MEQIVRTDLTHLSIWWISSYILSWNWTLNSDTEDWNNCELISRHTSLHPLSEIFLRLSIFLYVRLTTLSCRGLAIVELNGGKTSRDPVRTRLKHKKINSHKRCLNWAKTPITRGHYWSLRCQLSGCSWEWPLKGTRDFYESETDGLLWIVLFYVAYLLFCCCCFLSTCPGTTNANYLLADSGAITSNCMSSLQKQTIN